MPPHASARALARASAATKQDSLRGHGSESDRADTIDGPVRRGARLRGNLRSSDGAQAQNENQPPHETSIPSDRHGSKAVVAAKRPRARPVREPLQPLTNRVFATTSATPSPPRPTRALGERSINRVDSIDRAETDQPTKQQRRPTQINAQHNGNVSNGAAQAVPATRAPTGDPKREDEVRVSLLDKEMFRPEAGAVRLGPPTRRQRTQRRPIPIDHEDEQEELQRKLADQELHREKAERTTNFVNAAGHAAGGSGFEVSPPVSPPPSAQVSISSNSSEDDEFGFISAARRIRERKAMLQAKEASGSDAIASGTAGLSYGGGEDASTRSSSSDAETRTDFVVQTARPEESTDSEDILKKILGSAAGSSDREDRPKAGPEVNESSDPDTDDYLPKSRRQDKPKPKPKPRSRNEVSTRSPKLTKRKADSIQRDRAESDADSETDAVYTTKSGRRVRAPARSDEVGGHKKSLTSKTAMTPSTPDISPPRSFAQLSNVGSSRPSRITKSGASSPPSAKKQRKTKGTRQPPVSVDRAASSPRAAQAKAETSRLTEDDEDIDKYTLAEELVI
ncbi:unnamed protein product [Parajaminaea phylloscopi]